MISRFCNFNSRVNCHNDVICSCSCAVITKYVVENCIYSCLFLALLLIFEIIWIVCQITTVKISSPSARASSLIKCQHTSTNIYSTATTFKLVLNIITICLRPNMIAHIFIASCLVYLCPTYYCKQYRRLIQALHYSDIVNYKFSFLSIRRT